MRRRISNAISNAPHTLYFAGTDLAGQWCHFWRTGFHLRLHPSTVHFIFDLFFLFCSRLSFLKLSAPLETQSLSWLALIRSFYCIGLGQLVFLWVSILLIYVFVQQTQLNPRSSPVTIEMVSQWILSSWQGQALISLPWVLYSLVGVGLSIFVYCCEKTAWIGAALVPKHHHFPKSFYFSYINITTFSANVMVLMILLSLAAFLWLENSLVVLALPALSKTFFSVFIATVFCMLLFKLLKPVWGFCIRKRFSLGSIFVVLAFIFCVILFGVHLGLIYFSPDLAFLDYPSQATWLNKLSQAGLQQRFILFLLGWILIAAPLMGSWIARFSRGLTVAQSILFSIILPILFVLTAYKNTGFQYWEKSFTNLVEQPLWGGIFSICLFGLAYLVFKTVRTQTDLYGGFLTISLDMKQRSLFSLIAKASIALPFLLGGMFVVGWPIFCVLSMGIGLYLAVTLVIFLYKAFIAAGGF